MERIKDITKIFLKPEEVLLEIKLPANAILMANTKVYADHSVVVAKGSAVPLELGSIVLEFQNPEMQYSVEYKGVVYYIIPYYTIKLATTPDNFETNKVNLKIN